MTQSGWMRPETALAILLSSGLRPGTGSVRFFVKGGEEEEWIPLDLIHQQSEWKEVQEALSHRQWQILQWDLSCGREVHVRLR